MFAAFYKFSVKPGMEAQFCDAWGRLTQAIVIKHGSRGSRLHHAEGSVWFAYARWPTRDMWERFQTAPSADAEAGAEMRACLAGPVETLTGDVSVDLLDE